MDRLRNLFNSYIWNTWAFGCFFVKEMKDEDIPRNIFNPMIRVQSNGMLATLRLLLINQNDSVSYIVMK